MGLFARRKAAKENLRRVLAMHGLVIRYVTEIRDGQEYVLGRGGNTSIHRGEFILLSSGKTLFRSKVEDTQVSHLMSGDGVIIAGHNLENDGAYQTVTAHFVEYIK